MLARLRRLSLAAAILGVLVLLAACGDDDDDGMQPPPPPPDDIQLTLANFPPSSPAQGHYELWISFVTPGPRHDNASSMGKFRVDTNGNIVDLTGATDPFAEPDSANWAYAIDSFITIEPDGDDDDVPTGSGFIGGSIISRAATLTTNHGDALGVSFGSAAGSCVLATPSTSDSTDVTEGAWFTNAAGDSASLTLPSLPNEWIYEGWVLKGAEGTASLGRFRVAGSADSDSSGPLHGTGGRIDSPGFPFPGSDFPYAERIVLTPGTAFVTVEPVLNQDGPSPSLLRILEGSWGVGGGGAPTALTNLSSSLPSGSLSIPQ